jgi:hypothetical protein
LIEDFLFAHNNIKTRIYYIPGVGCLGILFAFARAGFILCGSILLVVTIFSYANVLWVAETGIRYENQQQQQLSQTEMSEQSTLIRRQKEKIQAAVVPYEVINLVEFYLGRFQKYLISNKQTNFFYTRYYQSQNKGSDARRGTRGTS